MDYARAESTARKLIRKNGRTIILIKYSNAVSDGSKPWRGSTSDVRDTGERVGDAANAPVYAVFVDPVSARALGFSREIENLFGSCEQVCIVENPQKPHKNGGFEKLDIRDFDTVQDGSTYWKIVELQALKPGTETLLYYLGLKR